MEASKQPDSDEMMRRYRLIFHRAERDGPQYRLCPFCARRLAGLVKHLRRDHAEKIAAMPIEAFDPSAPASRLVNALLEALRAGS